MSSRTSRRTSSSFARTSGLIFFFAIVLLEQLVQLSFDSARQSLIVHPVIVMGARRCGKMASEAMA